MDIHVDPPRHGYERGQHVSHSYGDICYRAIISGDCPLSHDYDAVPITRDEEAQLEWIKSVQAAPVLLEYPITEDDGTALTDTTALFATVAKLSSVMNSKLVAEGLRTQDARTSAAAAHGRMLGHAIVARDLILTFIARNSQEGIL